MRQIQVYPSILAADFSNLHKEIEIVERAGADGFHFDVMDGHFVPNITFGPIILSSIRRLTKLPFWVHLMISDPKQFTSHFIDAGADGLFIHPEIDQDVCNIANEIKSQGIWAGLALNPETRIDQVQKLLPYFTDFLIMTVNPGFGGQEMILEILEKIIQIKAHEKSMAVPPIIHVDGGVNKETVGHVIKSGADILVAGSSIFHHEDPALALKNLRMCALRHLIYILNETNKGPRCTNK